MTKGLFVGKQNEYIERFEQQSGELRLLASADGAEIMIQNIRKREVCFIEPCDNSATMEFFYILTGEIEIVEEDGVRKLTVGDYLYVHQLDQSVQFRTLTEATLLYISTSPQFNFISNTINEILKLADQVQEKDPYTLQHNERVKEYAIKISDRLNLENDRKQNIVYASLFHDVGKVVLPAELLTKASELTRYEWTLIKEHPEVGAEMLAKTHFAEIAKIIQQHHERLDGSGYPFGLRDDEIMLEARIIAVADVYDAMTTDRAYRAALPVAKAVKELLSMKGILYDEKVVDTLVEILKEEGELSSDNS